MRKFVLVFAAGAVFLPLSSIGQTVATPVSASAAPYGRNITLAEARIVASAAEAEARRNNWLVIITIVEPSGAVVLTEKMDGASYGSISISHDKATTAANFRRPTSFFQEAVKSGNLNSIFTGAMALEGGELILKEGAIIGAIGVSGATAAQDGIAARAGAAAVP